MRGLVLNTLLAIVWTLFVGEFSLRELALGMLLGFGILSLFPAGTGHGQLRAACAGADPIRAVFPP